MKKIFLLKWFLIALLLFAFFGIIGNLLSFFQHELSNKALLRSQSQMGEYKFWLNLINDLGFYIALILLIYGVHNILVKRKFTEKVKLFFDSSAYLLLISSIYKTVLDFIDYKFILTDILIQSFSFNFLQLIFSLTLFAVSDLVTLGRIVQEENELTI